MNRVEAADMRAHLHAVLCGCDSPMSTDDVARLAPWHVHPVTSSCRSCHPVGKKTSWNVLECHGSWHVIERPRSGHDIHPHLQRLERDGLVKRHRVAGDRKVYWSAVTELGREPLLVTCLDTEQLAS